MSDDLVTVAVFGDHTQAVAARIHLESNGVAAFLLDEVVAGGLFHLATAVGGIKLQVARSRVEEALRLLADCQPGSGETVNWADVDVGEPEEDSQQDCDDEAPSSEQKLETPEHDAEPSARESDVDRLFRAWLIGLLCYPVIFFAFWRLLRVSTSDEPLRPTYRRKLWISGSLIVGTLSLPFTFCCLMVRA
jgi:hypothetical protein